MYKPLGVDGKPKNPKEAVILELKSYPFDKVAIRNKEDSEKIGKNNVFCVLENNDIEKETRVKQIERSLETLTKLEREIITRCYMSNEEETDLKIRLDMGLTHNKFYLLKGAAINKIARMLRIN